MTSLAALGLNLHITHGDMKENVSGCFFSEHSVHV